MRRVLLVLSLVASACGDKPLTLRYKFDPADVPGSAVATLETHLAPTLPQRFTATLTETTLEPGVRYSITCTGAADCVPEMVIIHDAALGFAFRDDFVLRFAGSSRGAPERIVVSAIARDASGAAIARAPQLESAFAGETVELVLHNRERCGAVLCDLGQPCCDGRCVDIASDALNCGACGSACAADETCSDGACRCGAQPGCRDGQICCGGTTCADTQTDPAHCGACGKTCGDGESCVAGTCRCGGNAGCAAGERCCGDSGDCKPVGTPCPCGTPPMDCNDTCCGMTCIDLKSNDNANCGQCGRSCGSGPTALNCYKGQCGCGMQSCGANCCGGTACVDLMKDPANCGTCGHACAANESCDMGTCKCGTAPDCGAALCCGTTTKACLAQGTMNCGTCGTSCLTNETCAGGACGCPGNAMGKRCTSGTCCGASGCKDLMTDSNNCGGCGVMCSGGKTCQGGVCVQTTCATNCSLQGESCFVTTCRCGGSGGPSCFPGSYCCSGGCTDLMADALHCGNCNTQCGVGEGCDNGACTCNGGNPCTGGKVCDPTRGCSYPNGFTCGSGSDCQSGYCEGPSNGDHYCCSTPCPGPCRTCTLGDCQGVGAGNLDPWMLCDGDGSTCGNTGVCAGTGQCANATSGTPCCSGPYNVGRCNGLGGCAPLGGPACQAVCLDGSCS